VLFVATIETQRVMTLNTFRSKQKSLAISGFCSTFALEFANFQKGIFPSLRIDVFGMGAKAP